MHNNWYKIISKTNNLSLKLGQQPICPINFLFRDKIAYKIMRVPCNNRKLAKNQSYNNIFKTLILR